MPDEALISQIENILTEVIELGGANERSQIVPNLTIQDANPSGLTGFIIVSDDRDGDNILAKKVPSVTYTNNDLVNVLFPKGGEAVAFQQGSQSASGDLWEIVPSTSTDIFYDKGKVGIGTDEIPHGGIGWATLAIDGGDFAADGANIQLTTSADDYPTMQIFGGGTHDEVGIFFDSYYDGTNRSSTTDQNFQILATGGRLRFRYDSGVAAGAALTWNEGIALRTDGTVGIGTITPGAQLESVSSTGAQFRASHTTASKFLDITVDTNHDATFKTSSTGQIIFQPTTDSTDFLQVLDADGGTPIVNVDSTNERVGIGTATIARGKIAIEGANASAANGPTMEFFTTADVYPLIQYLNFAHDNIQWMFDAYFDGAVTRSSDAGSNFRQVKVADLLRFEYDSGVAQGSVVTWNAGITLDTSGQVGLGTTSPAAKLDIGAGAAQFAEMTAPGAGAANTARLYAVDNGAGKTQLVVIFNTGAAQVLATEP